MHDTVASDVRRMADVLAQSGYEIMHCGIGGSDEREPTRNRVRSAIVRAIREAPVGGILIVYFSGHGVVVDGRSWLVPSDVDPVGDLDAESLVPLVPDSLDGCQARLVLFLVDACRSELAESLAEVSRAGRLPYPADGAFVLMTSCRAGERSLYGDNGSHFTQALAEVLDRRSSARSLGDVYQSAVRQLARRAARTEGLEQHPEIVYAHLGPAQEQVDSLIICDGDDVGEAWRRAVESSSVWALGSIDVATADRVRRTVLAVVDDCARHWIDARKALSDRAGLTDVWSVQDYPVRVLQALPLLLPADAALDAAELAIVVVAPFLREVALSAGLRLAATIEPQSFARTYRDGPRSDLEITHAIHEHVCRRAEGLARRGRTEPRDALAMWLVHHWLAGRSSIWDDPAVSMLSKRVSASLAAVDTDLTEREVVAFLCALLRCIDADAADPRALEQLATHVFDRRTRTLGAALWLAGIMASDARRLPGVIVDHVGIGDDLPLSTLHTVTVRASWQRAVAQLTLHAVCDHPALYGAFDGIAKRADEALRELLRLDLDPSLSSNFPGAFSSAAVRPEVHKGAPLFDTPLLQFRLSDDKVRELLMGRQLYGEPDLAIRELYQNALDACRYRRTRREYRHRDGQPIGEWRGSIVLRQGVDEAGREYVECTDNGVGMGRETLMSTFANAGERFVYRTGFRAEQARWQELDPPLRLIPNSQFGVGVFSYFMIAEEILITTRVIGEDDIVTTPAYSVRIASSGSLFRITTSADMPGGGTRVRLYLTGEDRISVLRTMRRLLWVTEFEVTVTDADGAGETWSPEQLRYPGGTVEPLKYHDDLWWVPGRGGIAADGIRTNEQRYGLVVNLRGVRRPQFTVDRNRLRQWDKEWIAAEVQASLPELQHWAGLTLGWLWRVAKENPTVADAVFAWLVDNGHEIRVEGSLVHGRLPAAARVGCLPVDEDLFNGDMARPYDVANWWLASWRVGVWKGVFTFVGVTEIPEVACLDGFPVVSPLDAAVIGALYSANRRYNGPTRFGHPATDDLLEALADEEEPPTARLQRLRRYAITGLDLRKAREIPQVYSLFRSENLPFADGVENSALLRAVAAWAPPGWPSRRATGGWLSHVSSELHIPLGEVVQRVAAIVPTDWVPPPVGDLHDETFSWNDVSIFSQGVQAGPPWIGPSVSPAHVVRVAGKLGCAAGDVLALFDKFAVLGYEVAARHDYPSQLTQLEYEALRFVETVGCTLTSVHLFLLAARVGANVAEVRKGLGELARRGFLVLPAYDPHPDAVPTDDELAMINEHLLIYDYRLDRPTPATGWCAARWTLVRVSGREPRGLGERVARYRRLLDIVDVRRPVTMAELADLVYQLDSTVADAIALYRAAFPETADLSAIPDVAFGSGVTCHRYEHGVALFGQWSRQHYGHHESPWALSPGDIARGAAMERQPIKAFLEALAPFRTLGAPVPDLADDEGDRLADRPADRYDVAMLHDVDEAGEVLPIAVVGPLRLVQDAGRFGWTVAEAYRRMIRFVPLGLVVECAAEACPERIVAWQDLLILTVHRDGQAPALSGTVLDVHIKACASEIGESPNQVAARLRPYETLFGFELPRELHEEGPESGRCDRPSPLSPLPRE